jgi:signal peptidase II
VKKLIWPLVIVVSVTVADQLTKSWAIANLAGQPPISVLGEYVNLSLVYNEGGAMGTAFGPSTGYLIMALIILPILGYYLYRYRESGIVALPLAFIFGGALGNVIDRVRFGRVTDFIDVDIPDINLLGFHLERWWTFNIADACITCALVWLVIYMVFHRPRQ